MEAGWHPERGLTPEQRRCGGRRGGKVAGLSKRRRAMQAAVRDLGRFLTPEFLDGLSVAQVLRVKTLMARAYRTGHRRGYRAGYCARVGSLPRRKAAA